MLPWQPVVHLSWPMEEVIAVDHRALCSALNTHWRRWFIWVIRPEQRVTLNMGMRMPAWFDIFGLHANDKEDAEGIHKSSKLVRELVEMEIQSGIPSDRIVIGAYRLCARLSTGVGGLHSECTPQSCPIDSINGVTAIRRYMCDGLFPLRYLVHTIPSSSPVLL